MSGILIGVMAAIYILAAFGFFIGTSAERPNSKWSARVSGAVLWPILAALYAGNSFAKDENIWR